MNRRVSQPQNKRVAESAAQPAPAPASGSAERNAAPRTGLARWLMLHRRAAADAGSRLWARKPASVMGLTLTGLALAFPLLLATLAQNLDRLVGGLERSGEIAVFLDPGLDGDAARAIAQAFEHRDDVAGVTLRTPAEGLAELRSVPGLDEAIHAAGANPLPYLALVRPRDESGARALAAALAAHDDVDQVQFDQQWRDRLQRMLALVDRLALASALLFALVALLVVGNHVRIEVAMRREEIGIVKLLGASDGFVRRPFLWAGFWLGAFGAIIAVATALALSAWLSAPVRRLAETYGGGFALQGPDTAIVLTTFACGVLLGSIGAYIASSLQLVTDRAP
jgi:cell division transport system permease protein